MRTGIKIALTLRDRKALEALIANRNTPSKVVWRAQIILATAEGCGTNEIIRRSGKSKPCVWRWQERFMNEGVAGLTRDKTRPPGRKPLTPEIKAKVLALHGADDPFVPAKDVAAFEAEMKGSGVDYRLVKYPGAVHSFTHKAAGTDNSKGAAYNAEADHDSWLQMEQFLKRLF